MDVVLIILCWRYVDHLPVLLNSISRQKTQYRFATVICYNEPADETESSTEGEDGSFPIYRVFTGGNLGYGGGNNFAIAWAAKWFSPQPRYYFCLNSDITLSDSALEAIIKWADANPEQAVIGAAQKMAISYDSLICYGLRYNPMLSLISRVYSLKKGKIDYVNGGSLLLRRSSFPYNSIFVEDNFLFFEELELACRVKSMGYSTGYCCDSVVIHQEGSTIARVRSEDYTPEISEYFENINALRFTRDHCPWYLPTVILSRGIGKPLWLFLRKDWRRLRFWWLALIDFFAGRIRRFPFQQGWQPTNGKDRIFDAKLPV